MKSLRGMSKRMLSVKKLDVEGGGDERRNTSKAGGANGRRRQHPPRAGAGRRPPSGPGAGPPADPDRFVNDICRRLRSNDPSIAQLNVYKYELGDDRIEQIADAIASSIYIYIYMLVPKCALSQFANWDPSLRTEIHLSQFAHWAPVPKLGSQFAH